MLILSHFYLYYFFRVSYQSEIKTPKFREMFSSIQITVDDSTLKYLDCSKLFIEYVISNKYSPMIKIACHENFMRLDTYLEDYIEQNSIFIENLDFSVRLYEAQQSSYIQRFLVDDKKLNAQPNTLYKITRSNSEYTFHVNIIFKCQGFEGYNCNFEAISNLNYYRDPINKISFCESNIKSCDDMECDNHEKCNNRGKCYIKTFDTSKFYCVCSKNWYGEFCEFENNIKSLPESILIFSPKDELKKFITKRTCKYCAKCDIYDTYEVCTELNENTDINIRLSEFDETCGPYICRMKKGEDIFFYEKKLRLQ